MRLMDVQIIINSSNLTARYQEMQQIQTQIAQTHMAFRLNDDVQLRRTQIQESSQSRELKEIEDTEEHLRYWKKENFNFKNENNLKKQKTIENNENKINLFHIIDILA